MNKNYYGKRKNRIKSFLVLFCLFFLATVIPPVVAEVSSLTPIIQAQTNPIELVKQARVWSKVVGSSYKKRLPEGQWLRQSPHN